MGLLNTLDRMSGGILSGIKSTLSPTEAAKSFFGYHPGISGLIDKASDKASDIFSGMKAGLSSRKQSAETIFTAPDLGQSFGPGLTDVILDELKHISNLISDLIGYTIQLVNLSAKSWYTEEDIKNTAHKAYTYEIQKDAQGKFTHLENQFESRAPELPAPEKKRESGIWDWIKDNALLVAASVVPLLTSMFTGLTTIIGTALGALMVPISAISGAIGAGLFTLGATIAGAIAALVPAIGTAISAIAPAIIAALPALIGVALGVALDKILPSNEKINEFFKSGSLEKPKGRTIEDWWDQDKINWSAVSSGDFSSILPGAYHAITGTESKLPERALNGAISGAAMGAMSDVDLGPPVPPKSKAKSSATSKQSGSGWWSTLKSFLFGTSVTGDSVPGSSVTPSGDLKSFATAAATANGIPVDVFHSLIAQESTWNPSAIGDGGAAIGLTQLHEDASIDAGINTKEGLKNGEDNRRDPYANILGGARYLKQQIDRFGGDVFKGLAAYNEGPGTISKGMTAKGANYARSILSKSGRPGSGTTGASSAAPMSLASLETGPVTSNLDSVFKLPDFGFNMPDFKASAEQNTVFERRLMEVMGELQNQKQSPQVMGGSFTNVAPVNNVSNNSSPIIHNHGNRNSENSFNRVQDSTLSFT